MGKYYGETNLYVIPEELISIYKNVLNVRYKERKTRLARTR